MMQALTNGSGGNLCTIHARRPDIIFDRIAELYALAQQNLSEQLAYRQTANGLDFVVYVDMTDETQIGGRRHRYVSHVLELTGIGENGRPATNAVFSPGSEWGSFGPCPGWTRAASTTCAVSGSTPRSCNSPTGPGRRRSR